MKNFLLILFFVLIFACPCQAINWIELKSPSGNSVYLDKDSIKEHEGNYFYNIKFKTEASEILVITIQTASTHPFSARIRYYSLNEYNEKNGDYENITNNMTSSLEPVTYQSTINTCYMYLRKHFGKDNKIQIVL